MIYRGRFAPSPTGHLHFGSLVTALGSWLRARSESGVWIVRMEDIDRTREVPGASAHILNTLEAFGLRSDEEVIRQSDREAVYAAVLERLIADDLVYPCWCSRTDLAAHAGIHPPKCIARASDERLPAWRLRVPDAILSTEDHVQLPYRQAIREEVGDFVVRRSDGTYSYQLAVVVDDDAQRITEVVRGVDLLDSTPRQHLLQRMLGFAAPDYLHLPLVIDSEGRKLSKQDRARPVDASYPLPALRSALGFLGQNVPNCKNIDNFLQSAVDDFNVARIPRNNNQYAAMRKD